MLKCDRFQYKRLKTNPNIAVILCGESTNLYKIAIYSSFEFIFTRFTFPYYTVIM